MIGQAAAEFNGGLGPHLKRRTQCKEKTGNIGAARLARSRVAASSKALRLPLRLDHYQLWRNEIQTKIS